MPAYILDTTRQIVNILVIKKINNAHFSTKSRSGPEGL